MAEFNSFGTQGCAPGNIPGNGNFHWNIPRPELIFFIKKVIMGIPCLELPLLGFYGIPNGG